MFFNGGDCSMNKIYQTCRLLTCISPGGIFEKNKIYPFYVIDGYAYIILVDASNRSAVLYVMDAYEDDTYKIIGINSNWEDAKFKEVV